MTETTIEEEIIKLVDHFNDLQVDLNTDLFAAFKEYDRTTEQVFLIIEEHQQVDGFVKLQEILQETLGKKILTAFIKNNRLFDATAYEASI